ncbi:MAG: plasmid pRiA4b ORF-3 family protein [Alphaproteobacteria bacterium]|nr:plasmid pRiA4b ORF-3 family protein [Alphaproteobacteria bacterium]
MQTLPKSHAPLLSTGWRVYHLHIELDNVEPVVWRKLWVPQFVRLRKFSQIIQAAMGWSESPNHLFQIGDKYYGSPRRDVWSWSHDQPTINDAAIPLAKVIGAPGSEISYDYDIGGDWTHRILFETVVPATALNCWPICVGGANACPPEEVGDPEGYRQFQQALDNPEHPEFYNQWLRMNGPFDPTAFDMNHANQRIAKLR